MRFLFIIPFLFCAVILKAQQHLFFKPDNVKQIPSSECYNIMQDSRGYIWFSTEAGLCKYNGNSVKVYNGKEGLTEGATYNVWEDNVGKIWMTTPRNRVLFYDHATDSIKEAPFSKYCVAACEKRLQQIYLAKLSGKKDLWLSTQYSTIKIDRSSGKAELVQLADSSIYYFLISGKTIIPIKLPNTDRKTDLLKKDKILYLTIEKGGNKFRIPVPYTKNYNPEARVLAAQNVANEYFIAFDNIIVKINPDLSWKILEIDCPVLNLYVDKDNKLWVATYKGGVIYFPDSFGSKDKIVSLTDLSVSAICEDSEKGIWCTTLEKGVFYCRNKHILNYSNIPGLDKKSEFLKVIGNKLYTSMEKSELFEISKDSITRRIFERPGLPGLTDITCSGDSMVITGKGMILKTDTSFRKRNYVLNTAGNVIMGANQLTVGPDHKVFAINRGSLLEITGKSFRECIAPFKSPGKCLLASTREGFLFGCTDGLYKTNTRNFTIEKIAGIEGSVIKLFETKSQDVWIITKENGIYRLHQGLPEKMSDSFGLPSIRFSDIAEDKNENLWIASNIGLVLLKKPYTDQNAKVFSLQHGLNSNEILKVAVANEKVYASSYEGLCSFPFNSDLSNLNPPSIYVNSTYVNETVTDLKKNTVLAYNENNIRITYDVLAFKQAGLPVKLFYKIEGQDNKESFTEGRELLLDNLQPGNYKVTTFGLNSDSKLSFLPAVVSFEIKKPYWQTPLFIIGAILLFIGLVFIIVNKIIIRIERREEEKTRVNKLLAEYQMSALRAQMNPHFIFNCINSIQRYILTNKAEEAYNYLSKFSKLIRLVLNYAEENLISLAQEIEIVELYIELEQLRFENKFSYKIEMSDNVDVNELMVPVMIMQPYIENAIWHGLMNLEKGKTGKILIKLNLENELLHVVIEDNGVGLKQADLLSKKGHKSKGTQINSKRAEILNIISEGSKGNVIIEEISGVSGTVEGTRVIINIPQNNNEDE